MKYNIFINQYAVVKHGLELDLIDLAIFDFIKDFANSPKCIKMQTDDGIYFWISHKLILEAMPLLKIKTTQGLVKRIDNLIQAGVIKKHPDCDKLSKTLYSFGSNYDLLSFAPVEGLTVNEQPINESCTPPTKVVAPLNESLGVPPNKSLGYNINNSNNINNDNNIEGENKFSQLLGLTKDNLNVKQNVIDKIDKAFEQLIFPVDDEEVKRLYFVLCCSPKWRNKTIHALQMSLNKVQNYDRDFIVKLIEDSIAGGWQGLVFESTDAKYQDYLRSKRNAQMGGKTMLRQMSEEERKSAIEHLKMIEDEQY